MHIKWMDTCIKTRELTSCSCAGSGEEGVMEDVKRDKCVHIKWMDTCIIQEYLQTVVVQVVVKKVSWRM